jgi:hypothetical protein
VAARRQRGGGGDEEATTMAIRVLLGWARGLIWVVLWWAGAVVDTRLDQGGAVARHAVWSGWCCGGQARGLIRVVLGWCCGGHGV